MNVLSTPSSSVLKIMSCFSLSVRHSAQNIYTTTTGIDEFPEFVIVGTVDGQQIEYYDSKMKKVIPRQEWVKEAVDSDFWNRNTQRSIGNEQLYKNNLGVLQQRFNQTGGE